MSRITESLYEKYNLNESLKESLNPKLALTNIKYDITDEDVMDHAPLTKRELINTIPDYLPIPQDVADEFFDSGKDYDILNDYIADEIGWLVTDYDLEVDGMVVESLNEARNPENDEVNDILRRHLGRKSAIKPHEQEVLDKYGITYDADSNEFKGKNGKTLEYGLAYSGRKGIVGPRRPDRTGDVTYKKDANYSDIDYANYLTKEKDNAGYAYRDDDREFPFERAERAGTSMHQIPSLQPYSSKYRKAQDEEERSKKWSKRHQDEIDDKRAKFEKSIEYDKRMVKNYDDAVDKAKKEKEDILAKARAKKMAKNESLSNKKLTEELDYVQLSDLAAEFWDDFFWDEAVYKFKQKHNLSDDEMDEVLRHLGLLA